MDRYELAWAAGFFDGEGWAAAARRERRRTTQPMARINQADEGGVPQVLVRFQQALGGLGRIHGPSLIEGRKPLYRWEVSSRDDVELLLHLIAPWLGLVKLMQMAAAVGRSARASALAGPADAWRAWAAGLFDGEGSTYVLRHRSHEAYFTAEMTINQASASGPPEVLERFKRVVGVGHLYGPYRTADSADPVYRWRTSRWSDVQEVLVVLEPWLGQAKLQQAGGVRVAMEQPPLPRGNPAWGNRKSHCVHGHEYATARVRPFRARKGGSEPRPSHQCLECLRDYARQKREEKKRSGVVDTGPSKI